VTALAKTDETRGAVVQMNDGSALQRILDAARDPAVDVDKYERLMAMYERTEARAHAQAFADAMNRAQTSMSQISRDAVNKQTSSKYATFAALDRDLRPIYTQNGFSLSFDTADGPEGSVRVVCRVKHNGGAEDHHHIDIPADGKGAKGNDVMTKTHATMSAITYGRRALLKMIFNIAEVDDDGNGASAKRHAVITAEQAMALRDLMESMNYSGEKLYARFKIASVEELPAADYPAVLDTLKQIAAKRKGAA
jgi:hypothetical protein